MSGYFRFIYLLCLLAVLCTACSGNKNTEEVAHDAQPPADGDLNTVVPTDSAAEAAPRIPLYFQGAQLMAQPGQIPQNLKIMPVAETSLRPADAKLNPVALADGKAETSYQLRVERSVSPTIIYDLGTLADAAPLYGVYLNIKNAAEEGRKPIDYRPFVLSVKFLVSDGSAATSPQPAAPEATKADGDDEASPEAVRPAPIPPPEAAKIAANIESGAYLALTRIEWRSLNGEQLVVFERPFEFKSDRPGRLLAEIDYIFGEEDTRFLDIAEFALLTAKTAAGTVEPVAVDKLAIPAIAGCYRNREGRRIDIYASGIMRLAAPSRLEKTPEQEAESNERFASWRILNGRFIFNVGGDSEMSSAVPASGPLDFTPEFSAMQRDAACSDPWGDIAAELASASLGNRNDITTVWQSDCDGDRRAEIVAYLKNKNKVVILRHDNDWQAYSLWREMDLAGDFRLLSDPVSGNCILCEKNTVEGGWWINIYLSNNWYRSRRMTLPGE